MKMGYKPHCGVWANLQAEGKCAVNLDFASTAIYCVFV